MLFLLFIAIFGPFLAPYPYQEQDLRPSSQRRPAAAAAEPAATSWAPTRSGATCSAACMDGARISMSVAIVVQIVVLLIGVPIGAIAGWFGGRTDNILMRFTDVMYAFPDLLFIILLSVAFRETPFGQAMDGLLLVFVAIGLTSWVTVGRLVRGQMLALKETEFVEAARAIGVSDRKIVTKHLLPERHGSDHRRRHARDPGGDPGRGDARLHRDRRPGAARVVGQPRGRWPEGPSLQPHGSLSSRPSASPSRSSASRSWATVSATPWTRS